MEYFISQGEIHRRKKAFTALIIGILFGVVIATCIFDLRIFWWSVFLIVSIVLVVFWLTWWFLAFLQKTKLVVNKKYIKRIVNNDIQSISLVDIKTMIIKRRLTGMIREIYLWSKDNKKIFIGGFEDNFEEIKFSIEKKISKKIIKEEKELIDYDHWLFYPLLGILLGISGISFMMFLLKLNSNMLVIVLFIFSIFVFLLSLYFIFCKPISARQRQGDVVIDYTIGIIMFSGCVYILYMCWNCY